MHGSLREGPHSSAYRDTCGTAGCSHAYPHVARVQPLPATEAQPGCGRTLAEAGSTACSLCTSLGSRPVPPGGPPPALPPRRAGWACWGRKQIPAQCRHPSRTPTCSIALRGEAGERWSVEQSAQKHSSARQAKQPALPAARMPAVKLLPPSSRPACCPLTIVGAVQAVDLNGHVFASS